eukprot:CAMPEP_0173377428 /NCGR_PEP_ID=MMETSP1356-20130122/642_1 /TAXON_ID=77927 ORGANISM="Hemiselmis virescens, Strain PCC157" /NCGR_SAMPLE_ID=MMETSP1356 /ASSEMBLY_ACC=CAM_ASM_000847 /LENGTH=360 /DNA_ID=CAMNT_0014330165 /DNA_START=112 /DNA_END=1191 /DNA_ORIENTATION=+
MPGAADNATVIRQRELARLRMQRFRAKQKSDSEKAGGVPVTKRASQPPRQQPKYSNKFIRQDRRQRAARTGQPLGPKGPRQDYERQFPRPCLDWELPGPVLWRAPPSARHWSLNEEGRASVLGPAVTSRQHPRTPPSSTTIPVGTSPQSTASADWGSDSSFWDDESFACPDDPEASLSACGSHAGISMQGMSIDPGDPGLEDSRACHPDHREDEMDTEIRRTTWVRNVASQRYRDTCPPPNDPATERCESGSEWRPPWMDVWCVTEPLHRLLERYHAFLEDMCSHPPATGFWSTSTPWEMRAARVRVGATLMTEQWERVQRVLLEMCKLPPDTKCLSQELLTAVGALHPEISSAVRNQLW